MTKDWLRTPKGIAAIVVAALVILALALVIAIPGCSSAQDATENSRAGSSVAAKADVRVVVAGTNGDGAVVAKTAKPGVAVAIHRAKPGQPKQAGDKINVGTTDKKGAFELFSWQPGEYVLVGPNGETKAFAITATQRAVVVPFAVCVEGCSAR